MKNPILLDTKTRVVHDLNHLSESCNTDDIKRGNRRRFASGPAMQVAEGSDWKYCGHCFADGSNQWD